MHVNVTLRLGSTLYRVLVWRRLQDSHAIWAYIAMIVRSAEQPLSHILLNTPILSAEQALSPILLNTPNAILVLSRWLGLFIWPAPLYRTCLTIYSSCRLPIVQPPFLSGQCVYIFSCLSLTPVPYVIPLYQFFVSPALYMDCNTLDHHIDPLYFIPSFPPGNVGPLWILEYEKRDITPTHI